MKEMLEKILNLERKISGERGNFTLFALFLREDSENKWDLVVSAVWLDPSTKESFTFIAKQVQSILNLQELLSISRIVLLEEGNPILEAVNSAFGTEHSLIDIVNCNFNGLRIKHAYIITSKKQFPPAKRKTA